MLDAIGPIYRAQSPWFSGAVAGYRGQIGRNAAIPHALPNNIVFQAGDVLVTGATAPVWGYHSELERTMVIGPPSDEQKRLFDHMVALQDLAIEAIQPGVPCAEVDRRVRAYYEEHGLWEQLAPPRRARDRAALPRRAVPRPRRRDRDPAGHGVHRRAGPLRRRRSAASGTPTRSPSPTTASNGSRTTRATSRPYAPGVSRTRGWRRGSQDQPRSSARRHRPATATRPPRRAASAATVVARVRRRGCRRPT